MGSPLALLPLAATANPPVHLGWPKLLLWVLAVLAFRVVLVLVMPTRRCPACKPPKGQRRPTGPCDRCSGLRRVPRRDARIILRFLHAFVFAPIAAWRNDRARQAREEGTPR